MDHLHRLWTAQPALCVLIAFMAADVILGMLVAFKTGKASSAASFKGSTKKVAVLIVIGLTSLLDMAQALILKTQPVPIAGVITFAYIGWESLSIIENMGMLGIWVPKSFSRAMAKLRDLDDDVRGPDARG